MKKLLLLLLIPALICLGSAAFADGEIDWLAGIEEGAKPATGLVDLIKDGLASAGKWVLAHGEIAYFYDMVDSETGSETIAKLTLFTLFDFVNLDAAATIPLETLDEMPAPGLAGGVGVKLSGILKKFDVEWDRKWDVAVGALGGYRFDKKDWMLGPTIGVSGRF